MNSRTARTFRQVNSVDPARGIALRLEWYAARSPRARGRVNKRLRAIVAQKRAKHAKEMQARLDESASG